MARQTQRRLPNIPPHHHTHALHPLSFLCPLSRSAKRQSPSLQTRTKAKCNCQLHHHLPLKFRVNLPSFQAGFQTHPSLQPHPIHLVPVRASSCFPLPLNQAKGMLSLCPHLDEPKILRRPREDPSFLPRLPQSNPLANAVQAKSLPNLLLLLLWCAALCRTCLWTMPLCVGWPLRRPQHHHLSTKGPEADHGHLACLLLPVTLSERKMRMRKKVSRG